MRPEVPLYRRPKAAPTAWRRAPNPPRALPRPGSGRCSRRESARRSACRAAGPHRRRLLRDQRWHRLRFQARSNAEGKTPSGAGGPAPPSPDGREQSDSDAGPAIPSLTCPGSQVPSGAPIQLGDLACSLRQMAKGIDDPATGIMGMEAINCSISTRLRAVTVSTKRRPAVDRAMRTWRRSRRSARSRHQTLLHQPIAHPRCGRWRHCDGVGKGGHAV